MELTEAAELFTSSLCPAGKAVPAHLHVDFIQTEMSSDEGGGSHHGFATKQTYLYLEAVPEGRGHGANAILNKDKVIDRLAGILDLAPRFKPHRSQLQACDDLQVQS